MNDNDIKYYARMTDYIESIMLIAATNLFIVDTALFKCVIRGYTIDIYEEDVLLARYIPLKSHVERFFQREEIYHITNDTANRIHKMLDILKKLSDRDFNSLDTCLCRE